MTEQQWQTSTDPVAMLAWLGSQQRTTRRKLRLFVCAACRMTWPHLGPAVRRLIEVAEDEAGADSRAHPRSSLLGSRFHDAVLSLYGELSRCGERLGELEEAVRSVMMGWEPSLGRSEEGAVVVRALCPPATPAGQAELLRELFGDPFCQVRQVGATEYLQNLGVSPQRHTREILFVRQWRTWHDGAVGQLAHAIHEEHDFSRLPILADALEDAGCAETALLEHLRRAGDHVRGCWALDLVLDRS